MESSELLTCTCTKLWVNVNQVGIILDIENHSMGRIYLALSFIAKFAQMMGTDLGFLMPDLMLAIGLPLHRSIRISPMPSVVLGSSRQKGSVDLQHLSMITASLVLFVFIKNPLAA